MTPVDWVIMIFLAVAAVVGLAQGFIRSVFGLGGLVLGLELAFRNYGHAATVLNPMIHSPRAANAVAFVAIAMVIMVLAAIVGISLSKLFSLMGLGPIDMLAGAVFGFAQGVLMVTVCILATVAFYPQASWLTTAKTPRLFFRVCKLTLNLSPSKMAQRLQHDIEILKQGIAP